MAKTKRLTKEGDLQSDVGSEEEITSEASETEEGEEQSIKDKGPKIKRTKMNDLPSKDEQLQLNNTDTLLRSNLLKLQVEEMLKEVSCDGIYKKKKVQKILTECIDLLKGSKGYDIEGERNYVELAEETRATRLRFGGNDWGAFVNSLLDHLCSSRICGAVRIIQTPNCHLSDHKLRYCCDSARRYLRDK